MPLASNSDLKERGWEEPLDESPVDSPDGWRGGGVVHTGGNIYCRIWTTKTEAQSNAEDPEPNIYYEAVYGREFDGATIDVYEYRKNPGLWERREELDRELCSEKTDLDCAEVALELMEEHSPPAASGTPDELTWENLTGTYEETTITIAKQQFLQAYAELSIGGETFIARVPIDTNQLEGDIAEDKYVTDVVVSANDWRATHDPSTYDERDDNWKRRIHCLFKLEDTAIEAAIDEVCESRDGERVWAGWTTESQPSGKGADANSSAAPGVNEGSE